MSIAGWNRAQAIMDADIRDFVFWSRVDTGSKNGVIHVNSRSEIVINNALEENAIDLTIEIEPKQTGVGAPSSPVTHESNNGTLTFTAIKDQNANAVVFGMEPQQSGSGDASPTNVRSLAAYDELQYSDGTTTTIDINALAGEDIYGGTYNAVSGVLTITHDVVDLSSSNWEYVKTYTNANTFNVAISGLAEIGDGLCDRYKYEKVSLVALQPDKTFYFYKDNNSAMRISVRDDDYSNAVDFKASLSNGMNVCYPLATPVTYNGTPATKNIVSGTNTFSNLTGSYVAVTDAGNIRPIVNHTSTKLYHNVYRYGVRWNRVDAACTERLWDAADITMDVTNFKNVTYINADYSNPFDDIYPFNHFRLCDVDLSAYRTLQTGEDICNCVTKWDDNVVFKNNRTGGFIGAYRPEYWYTVYEDTDGTVVIGVSSGNIDGWSHRKAYIRGFGFATDGGLNSNDEQLLICDPGIPFTNKELSDLHTYANNSGFTIEDIYTYSAELSAMIVEYAKMNVESGIARGCDQLWSDHSSQKLSGSGGTTVTLVNGGNVNKIVSGTVLDFRSSPQTSSLYLDENRYWVKSIRTTSAAARTATVDRTVSNLTSYSYYSIHGCINKSGFVDEVDTPASGFSLLSNQSGRLGGGGVRNVFYRGSIAYGNANRYVLGAYVESGTGNLWICNEDSCDNYDNLDTTVHINTGKRIATSSGFIDSLHVVPSVGLFPFVSSTGGSASAANPVGDYMYFSSGTSGNGIFYVGGSSSSVTINQTANGIAGVFCVESNGSSTQSGQEYGVIPILKSK